MECKWCDPAIEHSDAGRKAASVWTFARQAPTERRSLSRDTQSLRRSDRLIEALSSGVRPANQRRKLSRKRLRAQQPVHGG
jgi:hypothetical protein